MIETPPTQPARACAVSGVCPPHVTVVGGVGGKRLAAVLALEEEVQQQQQQQQLEEGLKNKI